MCYNNIEVIIMKLQNKENIFKGESEYTDKDKKMSDRKHITLFLIV